MATNTTTTRMTSNKCQYDLGYLYSWPCIVQNPGTTDDHGIMKIPRLNFEEERNLLRKAFTLTNKNVKVRIDPATTRNLRKMVTLGCQALHYTGHGLAKYLAFEKEDGSAHLLSIELLQELIQAGDGVKTIKFVMVSACHSMEAGQAFAAAGVPHVVAIKQKDTIQDQAACEFMHNMYMSLCKNKTVREAFEIAVSGVRTAHGGKNQADKFVLLPKDANHDESIFENVPDGQPEMDVDVTPQNLLSIFQPMRLARTQSISLSQIIKKIQDKRLVTVMGVPGIGKTTLLINAAQYVWRRSTSKFDGVFYIDFNDLDPDTPSLAEFVSNTISEAPLDDFDICKQNSDLCKQIKNIPTEGGEQGGPSYLLVFDHVDKYLGNSVYSIRKLVDSLLGGTNCRILVGCCKMMSKIKSVVENRVKIDRLSDTEAAQIFYLLSPREINLTEMGCRSSRQMDKKLPKHLAITSCKGNPKYIKMSMDFLHDHKMKELPALLAKRIKEEEEEENIEQKKLLTQVPPGNTGGPPGNTGGPPGYTGGEVAPPPGYQEHFSSGYVTLNSPSTSTSLPVAPPSLDSANNSSGYLPFVVDKYASFRARNNKLDKEGQDVWLDICKDNTESVGWLKLQSKLDRLFEETTGIKDRTLNEDDWNRLQKKFKEADGNVELKNFIIFWPWYQTFLQNLTGMKRYWSSRLIQGLIGRGFSMKSFQNCEVGTFLLRFTENVPGCLAVDYVDTDQNGKRKIEHLLINIDANGYGIKLNGPKKEAHVCQTLEALILDVNKWSHLFDENQPIAKNHIKFPQN